MLLFVHLVLVSCRPMRQEEWASGHTSVPALTSIHLSNGGVQCPLLVAKPWAFVFAAQSLFLGISFSAQVVTPKLFPKRRLLPGGRETPCTNSGRCPSRSHFPHRIFQKPRLRHHSPPLRTDPPSTSPFQHKKIPPPSPRK